MSSLTTHFTVYADSSSSTLHTVVVIFNGHLTVKKILSKVYRHNLWPTADSLPTTWSPVNHRSDIGQGKTAGQIATSY